MNMHHKTVLITGGTGGIGQETAVGLAKLGAQVVVIGRDQGRGEAAVAAIKAASGNERVDLLLADMASQAAIHRLADTVMERYPRLDVLVNNVGLLAPKRTLTVDGIEATLAVNHLAPFLLTHLLLPTLKAAAPTRVVNVTGGFPMPIDLANLQAEQSFRGIDTYSRAKAVMVAVSYEFAQRLAGSSVTLNVAYPGAANTAMMQGVTSAMVPLAMRLAWPLFGIIKGNAKPARAARSSIFLASSPSVEAVNGQYFSMNSKPAPWPEAVRTAALRQHLWQISEQLTGLTATSATDMPTPAPQPAAMA